jgi:hypothetical protein
VTTLAGIRRVLTAAMLLAAVATGGCAGLRLPEAPAPCELRYTADRCGAITDRVATDLDLPLESVTGLTILPAPEPDGPRLGGPPIHLRVHLADGTAHDTKIACPGISAMYNPPCMDVPALRESSVTISGYRDTPCLDEDCTAVATPHPDVDPAAVAAAEPILVERMDVAIDQVGQYEIPVGTGSVPNGILSEATFRFVDDWPDGVSIEGAYVLLDVRSMEPDGRPFDNYYLHGWREGLERVQAVLVFEVRRFEPGAVLSIEDIVVR